MDPIDLQHLDKYVCGDAGLLDEILTIFIDQASMLVSRLDPALDNETWRMTTHTLKGASRGVGAWKLGDLAETAEGLEGAASIPARQAVLAEIEEAAGEAIEFARTRRDG